MTVRALPICPPSLTLPPDATVADAVRLMIQRGVNHIPLCEADGRFVALIASNAILHALLPVSARVEHGVENLNFAGDALPMLLDHLQDNAGRPARELADPDVEAVPEDAPMLEAARRLSLTSTPLPVVDADGRLLGMLSRLILLTYLLDKSRGV